MKYFFFLLTIAFTAISLSAQRTSFRGTVTDHNEEAIKGVEFYIDMKRVKETTNKRGKYAIRLKQPFQLITVYAPQFGFINWNYNGEKKIDFVFPEGSAAMDRDDFMALGYEAPVLTKEHDKSFYGSYGSILEILDRRFQNVRVKDGRIIVGRMGVNTVTGSEDPLILVNGVPMDKTTVETIPTQEVKSIRVLSKASETASYGLRGAAGVIIVTLKTAQDEG